MRWFSIRQAEIDPELRKTFERYGTVAMQMLLTTDPNKTTYMHQGNLLHIQRYLTELLDWLTEQYDRAGRKETWTLTMEAAITIFVVAEVLLSIFKRR